MMLSNRKICYKCSEHLLILSNVFTLTFIVIQNANPRKFVIHKQLCKFLVTNHVLHIPGTTHKFYFQFRLNNVG